MSTLAWPTIGAGLDAALVIDDRSAERATDDLAEMGVDAGPCGAAPLAAIREVCGSDVAAFRSHVGVDADATVVLLITEGAAANPSRHG